MNVPIVSTPFIRPSGVRFPTRAERAARIEELIEDRSIPIMTAASDLLEMIFSVDRRLSPDLVAGDERLPEYVIHVFEVEDGGLDLRIFRFDQVVEAAESWLAGLRGRIAPLSGDDLRDSRSRSHCDQLLWDLEELLQDFSFHDSRKPE